MKSDAEMNMPNAERLRPLKRTLRGGALFAVIVTATVALSAGAAVPEAAQTEAPNCTFIGVADTGKRIAYICDSSGSMLTIFDVLRVEIVKSVDALNPEQSFNVMFFQSDGLRAVDGKAMLPVTPQNKRRLRDFLDYGIYVKGETDPMPALKFAFQQELDVIYLLTDGDFNGPGNDAVVKFCKENIKAGKPRINTLAFIIKDSKDKPDGMEFVKALKAIAKDSGGTFKVVTEDDMGK